MRGCLLGLWLLALGAGCIEMKPGDDRLESLDSGAKGNRRPARDSGALRVDSGRDERPPAQGGAPATTPPNVGGTEGVTDPPPDPETVDPSCSVHADAGTCSTMCPEVCNGRDDDCDQEVDETSSGELCVLDHALGACVGGACLIVECTDSYRNCDGDPKTGCEVSRDDVQHCGGCRKECQLLNALVACIDDECVATGCAPSYDDCDRNPQDCETAVTSLENCAGCGVPCGAIPNGTPSCASGECKVGVCAPGFGDCNHTRGDGCEQTLDTLEHCGMCAEGCDLTGSADDCAVGVCLAVTCDSGFRDCDGNRANGCESLSSASHCGACGQTCDASLDHVASARCEGGACTLSCAPGYDSCDNDPFNGCETALDSEQNCLACGRTCSAPNAVMACGAAGCEFVRCLPKWGDCNADVARDGCETSLDQDATCGSCTRACAAPDPVCSGGTCSDVTCTPGLADCNQDGLPCEVQLESDSNNCGACGNRCLYTTSNPHAGALTCAANVCRPACQSGFADCNGEYRDGCETSTTSLTSCGACGKGCAIANASASCATGACRVQSCNPDFADCNGDNTSCETRIDTTQSCGACGAACTLPGAIANCGGSAGNRRCAITACVQPYLLDCDGMAATGCEIDRRSAVTHCGACGNDCRDDPNVASATCVNGLCRPICAAGFGDCDPARPGCETALRTLSDCGACGVGCARPGGSESCATGACALTGCDPGYDDCDRNPNNGCEPLSTLLNCGSCGAPCLAANGTGSCATGQCQVQACDPSWADCNRDPSDGCERNLNPPASGGQGPCLPDPSCTRFSYGPHDLFFCTANRSWSGARAACQTQLLGELVHVDDAAENAFVLSHLGGNAAWLGGSDATAEGDWRWANDLAPFWSGTALGTASRYANWSDEEPNASGDEDCALIDGSSGRWFDVACSGTYDFVCEVQTDLCPDDPVKASPGQCGCGSPETDADGDGTADCNDLCPADPAKTAAGTCGCGTPDTDSDGDSQPDCVEACDLDPNKTAPGACGCGAPDTNSDGDSAPDCVDECRFDSARLQKPCGFDFAPSNFDPSTLAFDTAPATTLDCQATTTIHTSGNSDPVPARQVVFTNWCGTAPTPVVRTQANGPEVVIIPLQGLTLAATRTLRVIGSRPVIFAVRGDVTLHGTINARGLGAVAGAGGNGWCSTGLGSNGGNGNGGDSGGGGGGGGGFASAGASGGTGDEAFATNARGGGGEASGSANLVPLRGGCSGGSGGNGDGTGPSGGAAGGGVQLSVSGTLTLTASAVVSASGGGGQAAIHQEDGGAGGGSGGGVLLEAGAISVAGNAWITANGGAGSSGSSTNSVTSAAGADGAANNSTRAPRGAGNDGAGSGGEGAVSTTAAPGGGGNGAGTGLLGLVRGAGGGGGGGGLGFIHVRGLRACTPASDGNLSPAASRVCP